MDSGIERVFTLNGFADNLALHGLRRFGGGIDPDFIGCGRPKTGADIPGVDISRRFRRLYDPVALGRGVGLVYKTGERTVRPDGILVCEAYRRSGHGKGHEVIIVSPGFSIICFPDETVCSGAGRGVIKIIGRVRALLIQGIVKDILNARLQA